jgi:hypothetical protein
MGLLFSLAKQIMNLGCSAFRRWRLVSWSRHFDEVTDSKEMLVNLAGESALQQGFLQEEEIRTHLIRSDRLSDLESYFPLLCLEDKWKLESLCSDSVEEVVTQKYDR